LLKSSSGFSGAYAALPMVTTPTSLLAKLTGRAPDGSQPGPWARFVELYTPLLLVWARRLGLHEHDAADLVQDLFAVLVVKLPLYRRDPAHSFRSWLRTVLLNRWRNQLRSARAVPAPSGQEFLDTLADPHPAHDLEEREYRNHLAHRALHLIQTDFHESTWKAFWEHVVSDRPAEEVAAELGVSVNAVYLARSRVLRRLREEFGELLD
jgi:RNA polymerase sigma-70 factor, ECF subfamily